MLSRPALRLGVNIDHVATLRNARHRDALAHPDLLRAAAAAAAGGGDSITFHLREDRRHILDEDVARLKSECGLPLNFEMAATPAMTAIAARTMPHAVCLVPEKRAEVTTEGGLDAAAGQTGFLRDCVRDLAARGIEVALFIDPDLAQIDAALACGAQAVEFHTGCYAAAAGAAQAHELQRLQQAAAHAAALGLDPHAGHGLTYANTGAIAAITQLTELNIGFHIMGEAMFVGLEAAVRRMREVMDATVHQL